MLIFVISAIIYGFNLGEASQTDNKLKAVNVLIYNGEGTSTDSEEGLIYCLEQAQKDNPNIHFNYTTTDVINKETLSTQDVLIISGGDIELILNDPLIIPSDIKKFIEEGKGYVGICAGAYAASNYEGEYGSGWGISPNINCTYTDYEGALPITLTTYGINTLKYSEGRINPGAFVTTRNGTVTLSPSPMANTPALYKKGNYKPLAVYPEENTILTGYAAILDDTYGSGRIILSGPHPELDPAKPGLVARMVLWASKRI